MSKFALSAACVGLSFLINSWTSVWLYGIEREFESKLAKFLDRFLHRSLEWNEEYIVVQNVWRRNYSESKEDITLVTQCSVNNLYHLIQMADRWNGSMSVAVLSPKKDFIQALHGSYWLIKCFPQSFNQATFHFVYPSDHTPTKTSYLSTIDISNFPARNHTDYCATAVNVLREFLQGGNYQINGIQYPQNTLRNVALEYIRTKYALVLDVDTFPSITIRDSFLKYVSSRDIDLLPTVKRAFVIPSFEAKSGIQIPRTKEELQQLYRRKQVRPFHSDTCPNCHRNERIDEWIAIRERNRLSVSYEIAWEQSFEPFFIVERDTIRYDERFKQYGFDRISQVCELYVAGYQFFVLNDAFVCHDGFKFRHNFHPNKDLENRRNFKIYTKEFIPELSWKYPTATRSCDDVGTRVGRAKAKFLPNGRN